MSNMAPFDGGKKLLRSLRKAARQIQVGEQIGLEEIREGLGIWAAMRPGRGVQVLELITSAERAYLDGSPEVALAIVREAIRYIEKRGPISQAIHLLVRERAKP
jgi:hypothetical protein